MGDEEAQREAQGAPGELVEQAVALEQGVRSPHGHPARRVHHETAIADHVSPDRGGPDPGDRPFRRRDGGRDPRGDPGPVRPAGPGGHALLGDRACDNWQKMGMSPITNH